MTEATVQLSEVVGVPKASPVAVQLEFVTTVTVGGHVIIGFMVSITVTN